MIILFNSSGTTQGCFDLFVLYYCSFRKKLLTRWIIMLSASSSLLEWEYSILVYTNTRCTRWRRICFSRIPCGTITKIHLNSSNPPTQSHTKWFVWQWENYNQDLSLSLSLSISQWKNSKNKTLKYWSHNSLADLSVYVLIIQLQFLTGFHSFPLYTEHPKQVSCIPHHLISHYISGAHSRVSSLFLFLFFFLLAY